MSRGASSGKSYPNVRPAHKSLKKIKAKLTKLTGRELTAIPLGDIVGNVNRSLRGWANYFHYRNSSVAMGKVRQHAEDRLRTHLMKRRSETGKRLYADFRAVTCMSATGCINLQRQQAGARRM